MASQKTALIIIPAEGAEEMEVSITGDCLVRGDVKVTYAGVAGKAPVKCARGLHIVPDAALEDVKNQEFDIVVIPGGPGCKTLTSVKSVGEILQKQQNAGKWIAAICAAPIVLQAHGIAADKVTSHFSVKEQLINGTPAYNYSEDRVVVAGKVVTSQGPGTSFEFALKLVELLSGAEKAQSLVKPLVLKV
ncbi:unnamed protein product [Caenorhabditis bovis]|uniref:D-lactate dehydratase n=1 Tax=Caenorhabditis bovis TaxID=2654633 RepID=A0A8S1EZD1_9PELO|nr:unnamed protein product [Caenorhabditis bovis]